MQTEAVLFGSIIETVQLLRRGEITPEELLRLTLKQIERLNPVLNAYLSVIDPKAARTAATPAQPLGGIPISVKDLILTQDFPTTAGSRVRDEDIRRRRDALLVARLRNAGAVIVGKTHLHEFAYGVTNDNAHFGPARNPWDQERVSGGSSGGSAVSVASGMAFASIGTDTRGSIRIPSSFCGVTGLKPTRHRVPLDGVIPLSATMDHAGPLTRTVEDSALLLKILSGSNQKQGLFEGVIEGPSGLRIGVCENYFERLDPAVERTVFAAVEQLRQAGMDVAEVRLNLSERAVWASRVIAGAEALACHESLIESQPRNYDPAVLQRLMNNYRLSAVDLAKAMRIRQQLIEEFHRVFVKVDCLIGASVPSNPPRVGQDFIQIGDQREEIVENLVRMNAPQNVAGIPAMVVPCGFTDLGLPVGLQLVAGADCEEVLFRIGHHFQQITDWHRRVPAAVAGSETGSGS